MAKIRVYFSGSLINAPQIEKIVSYFPQENFEFFLPHNITEGNKPHSLFVRDVFLRCMKEMENSDICIINLDCFGKDSSWECGWYHACEKPLIGYVGGSLGFLEDWMIKGGLDGILVHNESLWDSIINDPVLSLKKNSIMLLNEENIYNQIINIIENDKKK